MPVKFANLSMCWNAANVKPFTFSNTMEVQKDHPIRHLVDWTAVVARGAPGGQLKALVINCHGSYSHDYRGTFDSSGGPPSYTGGFGLLIGETITIGNADAFSALAGRVGEIHIYACGVANTPVGMMGWGGAHAANVAPGLSGMGETVSLNLCQAIANAARCVVVSSLDVQPNVAGPGLDMAPTMAGRVARFTPGGA